MRMRPIGVTGRQRLGAKHIKSGVCNLSAVERRKKGVVINQRTAAGVDDEWEVAVYGRNLTDETTYTYATDSPLSAGIYGGWVEEPRIIGLQARYSF